MRLHTDKLIGAQLHDAARKAGVTFYRYQEKGSHSRNRAFDVILEGSGRTGTRYGNSGGSGAGRYTAATWDEWGIFLGELFRIDPQIKATYYHDGEHFRWATGGRFDELTAAGQHIRHRWNYSGESVTGAYAVRECPCGAINRWLTGVTWDYLNDSLSALA